MPFYTVFPIYKIFFPVYKTFLKEKNLICGDFLKGESDKIHQIEMIKKKDCDKIYTVQISMWKCYHYILPFSVKYSFQRLTVLEIYNSDVLHLTSDDGKIGTVFLFLDLI